ncbi:uncharacterized protein LOC129234663 [Uloborus diversus]|uniref:uncharacterized protein LOC129234663 n=1 Tax=Uloborus diversus TaxID=327109 RepID=UPI0024090DDA|nr:uncharacterized protein LOC129234663 [Uloborus diversus]XP_054724681.1 uncharacterized protein LOC129234663 [Uloborus diversus]
MFDVFQNVLFGKKKDKSEKENSGSEVDDFVLVGQSSGEQAAVAKEASEFPYLNNKYFANNFPPAQMPEVATRKEETYVQNVPLQDVPFIINAALSASAKLDNLWQGMGQVLSFVDKYKPYTDDYDFSLERSVIAETMQK